MKINTNNWHYKIQDRNSTYPKYGHNLCDYMRGLFKALVLELAKKVLVPIWLITSPFFFIYYILVDMSITGFKGFLYLDLFSLSFFGLMIDIVFISNEIWPIIEPYLPKRKEKEKKEKIKKEKGPNIFIEYLKAKKKKICPIIEFVEEE